jgi:hypothetical protein
MADFDTTEVKRARIGIVGRTMRGQSNLLKDLAQPEIETAVLPESRRTRKKKRWFQR